MMGHQPREESLFYSFRLEDQIPEWSAPQSSAQVGS